MKKVSIIIPCYNSEKYIEECLHSAINQTYPKTEIIVIDDGSTDTSLQRIQKLAQKKVQIIQQSNRGASAARNAGLKQGTGDYIQYLDSDDILAPDKVANQVAFLEKFPGNCIASGAWGKFSADINQARFIPQKVWADYLPVDWLVDSWNGGGMMQPGCWLVPREITEKAGNWNEDLSLNDDGEYFFRIILASNAIKFCESAKLYYREVPNSLSRSYSERAVKSLLNVCIAYKQILHYADSEAIRKALMRNFAELMYIFHPQYPLLRNEAKKQIRELGFSRIEPAGGEGFREWARIIGFENALRLRALLNKFRK